MFTLSLFLWIPDDFKNSFNNFGPKSETKGIPVDVVVCTTNFRIVFPHIRQFWQEPLTSRSHLIYQCNNMAIAYDVMTSLILMFYHLKHMATNMFFFCDLYLKGFCFFKIKYMGKHLFHVIEWQSKTKMYLILIWFTLLYYTKWFLFSEERWFYFIFKNSKKKNLYGANKIFLFLHLSLLQVAQHSSCT